MAYVKQTWATGEIITAKKLNHIEDGIANSGSSALEIGITFDGGGNDGGIKSSPVTKAMDLGDAGTYMVLAAITPSSDPFEVFICDSPSDYPALESTGSAGRPQLDKTWQQIYDAFPNCYISYSMSGAILKGYIAALFYQPSSDTPINFKLYNGADEPLTYKPIIAITNDGPVFGDEQTVNFSVAGTDSVINLKAIKSGDDSFCGLMFDSSKIELYGDSVDYVNIINDPDSNRSLVQIDLSTYNSETISLSWDNLR